MSKKKKAAAPTRKPALGMFSSPLEEDDDEGTGDIDRANKELSRRAASCDMSLLEADSKNADIYDYDGSYDDFKQEAVQKQTSLLSGGNESTAPKSKYIGHLQSVAKVREIESNRRFERKLLKEREQEDAEFGDKQKFVTSAYRKKLLEEQKWEHEDRLADKIEEKTGASRQGMQGFYSNLFTKNIAFGGDVAASATSAYTAGSDRQRMRLSEQEQQGGDTADKEETKEQAARDEQKQEEEGKQSVKRPRDELTSGDETSKVQKTEAEKEQEPVKESEPEKERAPAVSREESILSAKERYLARKNSKK